jgi:HAL2 family 3'(2'),5'-bisphosphate nucleotidase
LEIIPTNQNPNGNRNLSEQVKNMKPSSFLPPVLEAVWEAAQCCERIAEDFRKQDHHTKDDASPVTVADYCSQALILYRLSKITPDIGVVAEEQGDELRERPEMCARVAAFAQAFEPELAPERIPDLLDRGNHSGGDKGIFWTLDPIDGTKGYLRGGQYAIALALIENGRPVFGVLGCPRYEATDTGRAGVVFYGGESLPAEMVTAPGAKPRAVQVSESLQTCDAKLCESVESGHTSHERSAMLIEKLGLSKEVVRMDSQAKYAAVAHGAAGVYMRLPVKKGYREKIWDHAAGVAVIEAAGGKVTDLNGKPLDFGLGETLDNNRGVLATNGALHPPALAVLKAITPKESAWE